MPRQKRPSTSQESTSSSKRRKTRSDTNIQGRSAPHVNLDPVVLSHIPLGSLSTVSDIVDVDGDGNCGFRTLAVFLSRPQTDHPQIRQKLLLYKTASNRQQLLNWGGSEQTLDELQANIDWDGSNCRDWPQCWLTVPDSGRLVANCCYDRAFVLFSSNGSYTFFPERKPAIDDLANIIAIVHIGVHYMSVALNARNEVVVPPPIFETTHKEQWIQMMIISNNWELYVAPPKENEQEEGEATGEQKDKDDAASDNYENDAADHYEADDGDHYKIDAGDYDGDDAGGHEADAGDLEDDVDECEGGTGDEEDEAVDYEDDTGDDDDDDSSDHQEFHHHSQKVEDHHLPRKFI